MSQACKRAVREACLAELLCIFAGVCTGGVHKGDNGEPKVVCMAHEAQRLAVAIGLWHAKISVDILLQSTPQ